MVSLTKKISSLTSRSGDSDIEVHDIKNNYLETVESGDETSESEIQVNENGAPVEKVNPLGYNIGYASLIYLVVSGVIGTGIFSTPGTILKQIGSIGGAYILWVVGAIIATLRILIYIEFSVTMPNRSGGDTAYLEQAYPRPLFLIPSVYAAVNVILSFLNSSAIAFAQYILKAADVEVTTWRQRGLGLGILTFTCVLSAVSTKWSLKLSNGLGHAKIITLLFISITGFVVLAGGTSVKNPTANFHNAMDGATHDPNSIANSIIKISFSYGGTGYAFNVVSELKANRRYTGYTRVVPITFFFIFLLYIMTVTAFYSGGGTLDEIKNSGVLTASLFFENVFKTKAATKALSVLVALSAFGHLIPAVISHSRSLRECGRQGVLPFKSFWVSTKPFGTPLGPILVTWIVNTIVMLAPPAGDAYNFVIDLGSYTGHVFEILLAIGLLRVRKQRKDLGLPPVKFRAPLVIIIIQLLFQVFVIIMPLVPPKAKDGSINLNGGDVSFFYATYCVVSVSLLSLCVLYYIVWQFIIPHFKGYRHRVDRYKLENGELGNRVVKIPVGELEEWDNVHGKSVKLNDLGKQAVKRVDIVTDEQSKDSLRHRDV
ncbi:Y+L amino acid transporter [Wickerhamomyces ciferrii]|uniref:Y+L amino acid transporter n=1 Tax=Wickerhamomyces ciferrii (strain ATCC 14091 / BCRC 22168 / CBS 111 / JCM 3599 / NBRC 0793 / NRRL Y-1031 F-60-10) TaxID=1206466 RepID=K0KHU3_WICCF|nr:Y+L amino acid transporter [Wickerhamomyces ciferrii]CCH42586.1 Y+L amino acid transporter [Wickerhamomyces ciferrii]